VGLGDCCGIPVPLAFAVLKAEQDKVNQPGLRLSGPGISPVPFDYFLSVPLSFLLYFYIVLM
jgi:hypothetical protein